MEDRILAIVHTGLSRRAILKGALGAAALAAAPLGGVAFDAARAFAQTMPNDAAILNLALTLENLEARAYRDAIASGKLTGQNLSWAQTFGQQEAEHVTLLTQAAQQMGATPAQPQASYNFPAFTDEATTLAFLRTLEETGVGAYTGAAPLVQDKNLLAVAGGILNVEARHTAILRRQTGAVPAPGPTDLVLTPDQVLARANPILGR
jgi:hypothetical protein